ncbi:MAG: polyprenyl synthetase family protein, partial [bacterium]
EISKGGKRSRGALTLLGYQLAGGSKEGEEEVMKASVAMEISHLGLLIQDDFMDQDEMRRGVKTIQTRYQDKHLGESIAVLAGDFTFGWVTEMLSNLKLPAEKVQKAIGVWGKYFTRVGYGQALDMLASEREATEEEILKVLTLKSGEYSCVLPLLMGAVLAGSDPFKLASLEKFGMELGLVFQLRDDYLAEYGESEKTGKPVGNDQREGKKTLVTLYGEEATKKALKEHTEIAKKLAEDEEMLVELVDWLATREN